MGTKTWLLMYADVDPVEILRSAPKLDREASAALVRRLFPSGDFTAAEDEGLCVACPRGGDVMVGVFPGPTINAAGELAIDYPTQTDWRAPGGRAGGRISAAIPSAGNGRSCAG